jgi:hypothetical protein
LDEVTFGPLQLLVIEFDDLSFHGQIRRELESVMNKGMIRLVDLLFIWKDEKAVSRLWKLHSWAKRKKMCFEPFIGGLIGYGTGGAEGARKVEKQAHGSSAGELPSGPGQDLGSEYQHHLNFKI